MCRICLEEGGIEVCDCKGTMVVHEECIREWIKRGNHTCEICKKKYTLTPKVVPFILCISTLILVGMLCLGFLFIPAYDIFFPSFSFMYAATVGILLFQTFRTRVDLSIGVIVSPAAFAYIAIVVLLNKELYGIYLQLGYIVSILPIHCLIKKHL